MPFEDKRIENGMLWMTVLASVGFATICNCTNTKHMPVSEKPVRVELSDPRGEIPRGELFYPGVMITNTSGSFFNFLDPKCGGKRLWITNTRFIEVITKICYRDDMPQFGGNEVPGSDLDKTVRLAARDSHWKQLSLKVAKDAPSKLNLQVGLRQQPAAQDESPIYWSNPVEVKICD